MSPLVKFEASIIFKYDYTQMLFTLNQYTFWYKEYSWIRKIDKDGMQSLNIIFTNPSARAGYDTRSIFKQSLTGLNSEFSFS